MSKLAIRDGKSKDDLALNITVTGDAKKRRRLTDKIEKGYRLSEEDGFIHREHDYTQHISTINQLVFKVKGATKGNYYTVKFTQNRFTTHLTMSCDCGIAFMQPSRNNCCHIAALIAYTIKMFVNNQEPINKSEIKELVPPKVVLRPMPSPMIPDEIQLDDGKDVIESDDIVLNDLADMCNKMRLRSGVVSKA
jgi:hypothetical protein